MNKTTLLNFLFVSLLFAFISCSTDDDVTSVDNFFSGAVTAATEEQLTGVWAFFSGEFEGIQIDIPLNYQGCDRDFFVFSDNGSYSEYIFQSSNCDYYFNNLNWTLANGVITLSNNSGQSDQLVIIALSPTQLKVKARVDVNEDGELDILILNAQRYQPDEMDMVSSTFFRNENEGYENLLSFTWDAYQGYNDFDRIEIYRSFGQNCTKDNAVLITTITDNSITEFTDQNPPGEETLCYYMKIYTNEGFLGESDLFPQSTEFINSTPVTMNQPIVVNDQIELSWEASDMIYFSHYEITFANHMGGSGPGYQEYHVATINERETTTFVDENPPYLQNPVYNIYVYDIFGNRTDFFYPDVTNFWEVDYKRDELTNFQSVRSFAVDPDEPIVYFFGNEVGENYETSIQRFNYSTYQTEAISNLEPSASSLVPIELIVSANGKELVVATGSNLYFYDAQTMGYKYQINPDGLSTIDDFMYTNTGHWVLIDDDEIVTYERDNANFFLLDAKPHYAENQTSYNYQCIALNNNDILVGHTNEATSILFSIGASGLLTEVNPSVSIPITDEGFYFDTTLFNQGQEYIINLNENRLYSTTSYSFQESFEQPYFPSGISMDGINILGSDNDPEWQITDTSLHAKEAVIYNRNTSELQTIGTLGYPHVIFENYNGELISISSGLKKEALSQNINDKGDIFIEVIDLP